MEERSKKMDNIPPKEPSSFSASRLEEYLQVSPKWRRLLSFLAMMSFISNIHFNVGVFQCKLFVCNNVVVGGVLARALIC